VQLSGDAEELTLVGSADRVATYHRVSFCYLVLYPPEEVGEGLAEVLDLALYRLRTLYLSRLGVGVVADEVRVEHLVDDLYLALTESLLKYATHLFLVRL
jgi:hypothetical protein